MKIIRKDIRKGEVKLKIENLDDLWYLSHIIDISDLVKGRTFRKIKIGDEGDRKSTVVKKPVFMSIEVTKIEFKDDVLRVSGTVVEGPEDVGKGVHHTFNVEEGTEIEIIKEKWLSFQLEKLKEAAESKQSAILICVLDREDAIFAVSKKQGYKILSELKGDVAKKDEKVNAKGNFFSEVSKVLVDYVSRHKVENIIVASPAFWKDEFMKKAESDLKKKITLATCGSVSRNAIDEVLKRPETKEVLKQDRIAKELKLVEELLKEISLQAKGAYGIREVSKAVDSGAVSILLVTDKFITKRREEGKYEKLDFLMKNVDAVKGEIHLINSEFEAGKKLDGLGGIGAILRYQIEY